MNCRNCSKEIPHNKRKNIFCSRSCAASVNNKVSVKRIGKMKHCQTCGIILGKYWLTGRKFCDNCKPANMFYKYRTKATSTIVDRKDEILQWIADSDNKISNQDIALKLDVVIGTWMKWNKSLGINYRGNQSKKGILRVPDEQIFCIDSPTSLGVVKQRIHLHKLIDYKCSECDIVDAWNNKPISLHLDHINGQNNDNRLENLRYLCPNCHSQTSTYCNKQNKGSKKVEDDVLLDTLANNNYSIYRSLRKLGLSGADNYNRVYKLLALHNIPTSNRYNIKQERAELTYSRYRKSKQKVS